ncbi:MAG: hypothetical protein AAB407_00930 [Patescibacteria group bacterium]
MVWRRRAQGDKVAGVATSDDANSSLAPVVELRDFSHHDGYATIPTFLNVGSFLYI